MKHLTCVERVAPPSGVKVKYSTAHDTARSHLILLGQVPMELIHEYVDAGRSPDEFSAALAERAHSACRGVNGKQSVLRGFGGEMRRLQAETRGGPSSGPDSSDGASIHRTDANAKQK